MKKEDKAADPAPEQQAPAQQPAVEQPVAEVKPTGTALAVVDYGEDAGAGLQNVTTDEISMPFIRILQSNSPQVDKSKNSPKFIGADKGGWLIKTSTQEVFDGEKGIDFIPVHRDRNFVEYIPHDKGRGFVGIHAPNDPEVLRMLQEQGKFKKLLNAAGNELSDTFYLFGLFIASDNYIFPGALGLASTQIPRFKQFMDIATAIKYPNGKGGFTNPPMWAHRWHIQVVPDQNKKGSFYSFKLSLVNGATPTNPLPARIERDDPLYTQGRALYDQIAAGRATVKHEDMAGDKDEASDDMPF